MMMIWCVEFFVVVFSFVVSLYSPFPTPPFSLPLHAELKYKRKEKDAVPCVSFF